MVCVGRRDYMNGFILMVWRTFFMVEKGVLLLALFMLLLNMETVQNREMIVLRLDETDWCYRTGC